MIRIRRTNERGHRDHGWLNTYHSFSFADYYDKDFSGYGNLLVLNDDRVSPQTGFGMHPHRDMEIITYVLSGEIYHKDNMGNSGNVGAGDVQYMSAGTGVRHSETNPSTDTELHLLQIWIIPDEDKMGVTPRYGQQNFPRELKINRFFPIAAPKAIINTQDKNYKSVIPLYANASIWVGIFDNYKFSHKINPLRKYYLHLAKGSAQIDDFAMVGGDALMIEQQEQLNFSKCINSEMLLFELI